MCDQAVRALPDRVRGPGVSGLSGPGSDPVAGRTDPTGSASSAPGVSRGGPASVDGAGSVSAAVSEVLVEALAVPVPGRAAPALVVLIGAAGAGKSTWSRANYRRHQVVCLDQLRLVLADDESDQDATGDAVELLNAIVRARLGRQLTTVVDATNVTLLARRTLLDLAGGASMPAVAVVFTTPLLTCLARNARRPGEPRPGHKWARRVPGRIVYSQHVQACAARMLLADEGWSAVRHVDAAGVLR